VETVHWKSVTIGMMGRFSAVLRDALASSLIVKSQWADRDLVTYPLIQISNTNHGLINWSVHCQSSYNVH
jgi:hypothetical protein